MTCYKHFISVIVFSEDGVISFVRMRERLINIIVLYYYFYVFSDIYVCCTSHTHQVAADGFFIALVATTVETSDPEKELRPGIDLLGEIKQKYGHFFIHCTMNIELISGQFLVCIFSQIIHLLNTFWEKYLKTVFVF